jgi:hypothetical protein
MWTKIWKVISPPFYFIGALASIASVVLLIFADKDSAIIALVFLCVALTLFLISLIKVLNRFLERHKQNYKHISSFIQYTCDDGDNIK